MNERIQELAEQANIEFTYDPTETPMRAFAECWEDDLKKFAELIVRECASIADDGFASSNFGNGITGHQLLKHFGVEE